MSPSAEKFLEEALKLSEEERSVVAASLIDSLDQTSDQNIDEAWESEINERLKQLDNGSSKCIPWPDARKAILK